LVCLQIYQKKKSRSSSGGAEILHGNHTMEKNYDNKDEKLLDFADVTSRGRLVGKIAFNLKQFLTLW